MDISIIITIIVIVVAVLIIYPSITKCRPNPDHAIKILVRQAARWAIAATQDKNTMIAILHANYAAGYLWALIDIAKPEDIERATGIDFDQFKKEILTIQDGATEAMAKACPIWAPEPTLLVKIARGES